MNSISAKVENWQRELEFDEDRVFLLDGIRNGFRIVQADCTMAVVEQKNHKSALQAKSAVEKELKDQISNGHYIISSKKPTIVSALAAIPKAGDDVRIIHDGSRPSGQAMNDYSVPESVKFQSLGDACALAKTGYWCAKVDLKSAYRSVCIHPDNYCATGLKWTFGDDKHPTYMFDSRLPFGSNVGPACFHRLSQAVRRCMIRRGMRGVVAYIDDFLLAAETRAECEEMLSVLIKLLRDLGFSISWQKVVGPTQRITFLGVEIDTKECTLSLGDDKRQQLQQKLQQFQNRKRASKQQLQSLAGSLNWASYVVRGGRFFLRRILDAIKPLQHQAHKTRLTQAFREDLQWWMSFLHVFNGTVYLSKHAKQHVYVDACNTAVGAFYRGDWLYSPFIQDTPAAAELHINFKEVIAVVKSVERWLPLWRGMHVVFHTDSTVTKGIINKGRSTNPYVNSLLRKMAWDCARANCSVSAVHVAGAVNIMADTISRLHEGRAQQLLQLLSNYHHGRTPWVDLASHMSYRALCFLSLQVPRR